MAYRCRRDVDSVGDKLGPENTPEGGEPKEPQRWTGVDHWCEPLDVARRGLDESNRDTGRGGGQRRSLGFPCRGKPHNTPPKDKLFKLVLQMVGCARECEVPCRQRPVRADGLLLEHGNGAEKVCGDFPLQRKNPTTLPPRTALLRRVLLGGQTFGACVAFRAGERDSL